LSELTLSSRQPLPPQQTQTGVVSGATAILSSVNGLTPHMAGAIDIMVVEQPDGTLRCSPFYGEGGGERGGERGAGSGGARFARSMCALAVH